MRAQHEPCQHVDDPAHEYSVVMATLSHEYSVLMGQATLVSDIDINTHEMKTVPAMQLWLLTTAFYLLELVPGSTALWGRFDESAVVI